MRPDRWILAVSLITSCLVYSQQTTQNNSSTTPSSSSTNTPTKAATNVVPIPEAAQQYSSPTPVNVIVVDGNGTMSQQQYMYEPALGGVVINNTSAIGGDGASIFFPDFSLGFVWWNGYWADYDGFYWNGFNYAQVNNSDWHHYWHHYWHHDWNHRWHNYWNQHHKDPHWVYSKNKNWHTHHGTSRHNLPHPQPHGGKTPTPHTHGGETPHHERHSWHEPGGGHSRGGEHRGGGHSGGGKK